MSNTGETLAEPAASKALPRLARQVLWMAAALILVSGCGVLVALLSTWRQTHDAGQALNRSFARIVQEQTDNTVQSVDERLQLADAGLQQLRATKQTVSEADARALLRGHLRDLPYMRALWVLDAKGRIQFDSDEGNIGVDLSDRAYFQVFLSQPQTQVHLGAPVRSRVNQLWVVTVARAVRSADGVLDHVVVAALDPFYFEKLWQQLDLGPGGSVALFRSDAVLLMRSPILEDSLGKTFADLPFFKRAPKDREDFLLDNTSQLDGQHRHYAYRALAHYPAAVVVGLSHETMIKPWRGMAILLVAVWAIGASVVTLLSLYLATTIRKRFQAEEDLRDSNLRWRFALEGAGDGIWDWDVLQETVFYSRQWAEILGHTLDEVTQDNQSWLGRLHPEDKPGAEAKVLAMLNGETRLYQSEHRLRCKDGSYKWVLARGMAVQRSPGGQALRVVGITSDITERKLAQEATKASLTEKTALLNEVHHRVKNNLQVVSSLLRLEAGRSAGADAKTVLTDMQGRVRAMALLHESLYRKGVFASVDLGAYLKQLATQAFRALAAQSGNIRLVLDLATVNVSMDQATPCGLLVNELISNSLKHGFPLNLAGEVRVELQPVPESDLVRLRVSDTGVGLPDDFEARCSASLGLQLAFDLARQIGGHLDVGPGASFEVLFPLDARKSQAGDLS